MNIPAPAPAPEVLIIPEVKSLKVTTTMRMEIATGGARAFADISRAHFNCDVDVSRYEEFAQKLKALMSEYSDEIPF